MEEVPAVRLIPTVWTQVVVHHSELARERQIYGQVVAAQHELIWQVEPRDRVRRLAPEAGLFGRFTQCGSRGILTWLDGARGHLYARVGSAGMFEDQDPAVPGDVADRLFDDGGNRLWWHYCRSGKRSV